MSDDTLFEIAVSEVLKWEGGFVNDQHDPGGATNMGISLRFYRSCIDERATPETVKKLTKEDAVRIYRDWWWEKYKYNQLPWVLGKRVFNFSVNMGHKQAVKLLQRSLRAAGKDIKDDGILGPITLKTAKSIDVNMALSALRSEAAGFYRLLAATEPYGDRYLRGWLDRAYS